MAKKSMIEKWSKEPKFSTRTQNRCQRCGRPHSVYRKFGLCRVCFRELASKGELPGVRKFDMCRICFREQSYKGAIPGVTKASW